MSSIADVATQIRVTPAPVLILDTCNYLDLFRCDDPNQPNKHLKRPRVLVQEIQTAVDLLALASATPKSVHLIAPELVPGEFADNKDGVAKTFQQFATAHDFNQRWLTEATTAVNVVLPTLPEVSPFGLEQAFRSLATSLLARATVLDRDHLCLERAVARLIAKRRPSHKKEIKDSMNLEQSLELARQLAAPPALTYSCLFVSSNTSDFAEPNSTALHHDLQAEFAGASVEYFTSLESAVGWLRSQGQL